MCDDSRDQIAHLKEELPGGINGLLCGTVIVPCTTEELRPEAAPTEHSFEMKEPTRSTIGLAKCSPETTKLPVKKSKKC